MGIFIRSNIYYPLWYACVQVPQSTTTVLHLKKAIRRHYELVQRRRVVDPPTPPPTAPSAASTATTDRDHRNTNNNDDDRRSSSSNRRAHRHHHHHTKSAQSSSDRSSSRQSYDRSRAPLNATSDRSNRDIAPPDFDDTRSSRISWRFVWRKHWLDLDGVRLVDDNKYVRDYGVINNSVLRFVQKRRVSGRSIKR